jgi:hypothetical protein
MTDARDDQDISEALDDDKLPADFPPDRPLGVDEYGVTPGEELVDEPLEARVRREIPDNVRAEDTVDRGIGSLVEPDQGGGRDTEPDAVAGLVTDGEDPDQLDPDDLLSGDPSLRDVAQERVDDTPAEEAAIHVTDPPPMGDGDGYLEDE